MSANYKDIVITPFRGDANNNPVIRLSSGDATTNSDMNVRFYSTSNGTLSFEGASGQVFSVTNDMMAYFSGKVGIGNTAPDSKLVVQDTLTINNASLFEVNPTWNSAANTFTAMKVNVTDSNSAASSLIADFQVGGTSKFKVAKDGMATVPSNGGVTSLGNLYFRSSSGASVIFYGVATDNSMFSMQMAAGVPVFGGRSTSQFGWTSGADANGGLDTILTRKAAANLRFGAADAASPVAQTLSVQSVVAGTTNIAGANLTITGSQGTGTGAGGSLIFQVAPAGSTGSTQNALADALTINSSKQVVFGDGSVSLPSIRGSDADSGIYFSGNNVRVAVDGELQYLFSGGGNFNLVSAASVRWADGGNLLGSYDLLLNRDAANILAQRNGVNAQTFRLYNTYTDASNYERIAITANSTAAYIQTEKAGTGTARPLYLGANNTNVVSITTAGLVGIGTSNPTEQLHISGNTIFDTTSSERKIITNGGGYIKFGQNSASNKKLSVGGFSDGVYFDQSISFTANQTGVVGSSGAALLFGTSSGPNDIPSILIKGSQGNDPANPVVRIWDTSSYATHRVLGVGGGTTYSEYLTVLNSGNVGIGNTAPPSLLTVGGGITSATTGAPYVELMRTGQSHWKLQHLNNGLGIQNSWAGQTYRSALVFDDGLGISTQELLRLGYFGGVGAIGIGISAPTAKLTVANSTSPTTQHNYGTYTDASNYERIAITANSSGHYIIGEEGGTGSPRPLYLGSNNSVAMTIATNSSIYVANTISDRIGDVRKRPTNLKTASYILTANDSGMMINITTGGITVPNTIFSDGDSVTIYNNSSASQSITTAGGVTMYLVGTALTGTRTLGQRGLATVVCVSANNFIATGGGLT